MERLSNETKSTSSGGCQCGAVRFDIDWAEVLTHYACHCLECQKQSVSAFGLSLRMNRAGLRLRTGTLSRWERRADSGRICRANFCTNCGCRIFHDRSDETALVSLKAGTLDEARWLTPVGHIWTSRAVSWMRFDPEALTHPAQPDSYDAFIAAWASRSNPLLEGLPE